MTLPQGVLDEKKKKVNGGGLKFSRSTNPSEKSDVYFVDKILITSERNLITLEIFLLLFPIYFGKCLIIAS